MQATVKPPVFDPEPILARMAGSVNFAVPPVSTSEVAKWAKEQQQNMQPDELAQLVDYFKDIESRALYLGIEELEDKVAEFKRMRFALAFFYIVTVLIKQLFASSDLDDFAKALERLLTAFAKAEESLGIAHLACQPFSVINALPEAEKVKVMDALYKRLDHFYEPSDEAREWMAAPIDVLYED